MTLNFSKVVAKANVCITDNTRLLHEMRKNANLPSFGL